jgi:hypothetical protein
MISRPGRLAVVAVLAGLSPAARAQPSAPPPLVVRAPTADCAAAPPFLAFVDSLRVELASSGPACCSIVAPDAAVAAPALTLTLTGCDPGADRFTIEVADQGTGRTRSRPISFADVTPDARPRALALAVAELVRSTEAALSAETRAPAAALEPAVTPSPDSGPRGAALADVRAYPGAHTVLWGGRVAMALDRARWRGELDLGAAGGSRQVSLGRVDVTLAAAGLAVGPRFRAGAWAFDLGAVGELGWARIDGEPGQGGVTAGSGSGLTAAFGARAGAEAPASRSLRFRLVVEAGGVARRLTGDVNDVEAAGISGPYVRLGVGLETGL